MVISDEIEEIFKKLEGKLTRDEFNSRIEEKITLTNGLVNYKTAAMLIASEMGVNENVKIKDITEGKGIVTFIAKVLSISDIHEFSRDNTTGWVVNLNLADDTGSIKAALWNEACDLVKIGDIKPGQSLKVKGSVKQGKIGLEVNVGRGGGIEHIDSEVSVNVKPIKISEVKNGMNALNITGKIIDMGSIRTFMRKDGVPGKVRNITIGDPTGKIRVTLWDAKADASEFKAGEIVELINAYARDNSFSNQVEIQLGNAGRMGKSSAVVDYSEPLTPIADIGINSAYSVSGEVSGIEAIHEFERTDGTKNRVSNIYVSDKTGRIKVALWGEHAEIINELDIGSEIRIIDAYAKPGRNEEIELSAGARTRIEILRK
jgi:replication factor A1